MKKTKFKMTGNGSGTEKSSESSCLCASVLKKDAGMVEGGFNTETQRRRGTEFKMAEIGLIPEDWECCKIGELAKICTGNRNTQDKNDNGRYPFYVRSPIVERIDEYGFNTEGVVTVGDGAGTGKVFHYVNGCFGLHQRCYLIDSFNERLNAKYFYKVFSERFFNRVMQMTAKSSVDSVRREMITEMLIPVPPLSEQKAIAEALSDVDELLAAMTTLIEKKRAIKQGAMQELLTGKKRLVGFKNSESSCLCASVLKKEAGVVEGGFNTETQRRRGTEFKMTEIGLIPEDWEVKPLSSIGIFSKGSGISRSEANSGVLPCVRYGEIYTDHNDYIKEFKSFISESVAINAKRLVDGDILFAGSGETKEEIGKAVAYLGGAERVYCGGDILVLSPFSDFDSKFLGYVCNSQAAVSQKSARGQGDAVVHIRTSNLAEVLIPIPPLPEQKAIAEVLSDMDAEIEALEAKRAKCESIKQGMMQELLTGKIRLEV